MDVTSSFVFYLMLCCLISGKADKVQALESSPATDQPAKYNTPRIDKYNTRRPDKYSTLPMDKYNTLPTYKYNTLPDYLEEKELIRDEIERLEDKYGLSEYINSRQSGKSTTRSHNIRDQNMNEVRILPESNRRTTRKPDLFLPESYRRTTPSDWYIPYIYRPTTHKPYQILPYRYTRTTRKPYRYLPDSYRRTTYKPYRYLPDSYRRTTYKPYRLNDNFNYPTIRPISTDLDQHRYESPTSHTAITGGIIGGIFSAVFFIIWILTIVYRRCGSRNRTRSSGIIINRRPDDMERPLLVGSQALHQAPLYNPASAPAPGRAVGSPNTGQIGPSPPAVPQTSANENNQASTATQIRQRIQDLIQLRNALRTADNTGLSQPDQNDPAVEAFTDLDVCSRMLRSPLLRIEVGRDTVFEDLVRIYRNLELSDLNGAVICRFRGERGLDAGGVTKDLYTSFWQAAKSKYFKGNIAVIPYVNLGDYDLDLFTTLGRIFSHTTLLLRAIPIQICRSTLNVIIYGEMELAECSIDTVIEDFMLFLDQEDRDVTKRALAAFEDLDELERTKLRYIFQNFEMDIEPQKETFRKDLSVIAYNELCVKPRGVCQKMGNGIPDFHRVPFWGHMTLRHIDALYDVFRPTPMKVIEKLTCMQVLSLNPASRGRTVFNNLKRFISSMSDDLLLRFLHFVTGERKIPNDEIIVRLTLASGATRAPKAHTCSNLLELPLSYTDFDDLRREFSNVLHSDEAMQMSME